MPASTYFLIFLSAIVALALAVLLYYYKPAGAFKHHRLFTFLRFISLFSLLVLLINPKIHTSEYYSEKPHLVFAVDNSASIKNAGFSSDVSAFVNNIVEHPDIKERFETRVYTFGEDLIQNSSFQFDEPQTNIQGALKSLDKLYKDSTSPTILITDGNQTFGEDYRFSASRYNNKVFPVVAGDTTSYQDLEIKRVNVNKYAFLDNRFPIELLVNYKGKEAVRSTIEIKQNTTTLFSEEVSLDRTNNSKMIQIFLPASRIGMNTYEAEITPLADEKNVQNNQRDFAVEVIDERTSILLLTDIIHPDLGVIKRAVEANQQRKVDIHQINTAIPALEDYHLVFLYQPN